VERPLISCRRIKREAITKASTKAQIGDRKFDQAKQSVVAEISFTSPMPSEKYLFTKSPKPKAKMLAAIAE
jgi:hypothetical protein